MIIPSVRNSRHRVRSSALLLLLGSILTHPGRSLADTASRALPIQPVAGPVEPPRGRFDLELSYGFRTSDQVFGPEGAVEASPAATWTVHEVDLRAMYGISDRMSAFFEMPILYPSLSNALLDAPLRNASPLPGDASFGLRLRVWEKRRPWSGLSLELRGRAPTGLEAAGDLGSTLLTGTGIPEVGAGLSLRRSLAGKLAFSLSAGLTGRISQVVAYAEAIQPDGGRGDARFHPGNTADARLAIQIDPVSRVRIELSAHGAFQEAYALGTTQSRWFPSRDLTTVAGTEGLFADAGVRVAFALGARTEAVLNGQYRFLGRTAPELAALGLEAYSPYPGWSAGLALLMRL